MITPTIGRVVWVLQRNKAANAEPEAAIVAYVWSDRGINVGGFDANGQPFALTSLMLLQDNDNPPAYGPYAVWMPYQKGQAAKTEQLQEQLKERA